jgi:hypothetical protein
MGLNANLKPFGIPVFLLQKLLMIPLIEGKLGFGM